MTEAAAGRTPGPRLESLPSESQVRVGHGDWDRDTIMIFRRELEGRPGSALSAGKSDSPASRRDSDSPPPRQWRPGTVIRRRRGSESGRRDSQLVTVAARAGAQPCLLRSVPSGWARRGWADHWPLAALAATAAVTSHQWPPAGLGCRRGAPGRPRTASRRHHRVEPRRRLVGWAAGWSRAGRPSLRAGLLPSLRAGLLRSLRAGLLPSSRCPGPWSQQPWREGIRGRSARQVCPSVCIVGPPLMGGRSAPDGSAPDVW